MSWPRNWWRLCSSSLKAVSNCVLGNNWVLQAGFIWGYYSGIIMELQWNYNGKPTVVRFWFWRVDFFQWIVSRIQKVDQLDFATKNCQNWPRLDFKSLVWGTVQTGNALVLHPIFSGFPVRFSFNQFLDFALNICRPSFGYGSKISVPVD